MLTRLFAAAVVLALCAVSALALLLAAHVAALGLWWQAVVAGAVAGTEAGVAWWMGRDIGKARKGE
jgi:hypothetical protein